MPGSQARKSVESKMEEKEEGVVDNETENQLGCQPAA